MLILGIETSCDETSCAVLEDGDIVRSNVVSSSLFRHKPFGGIVPEIASRHCLEQIDFVYKQALAQAGVQEKDIDGIAVTYGPGLIGSLLVGVSFAKALSYQLNKPLIPVNHLEAHLEAAFISNAGAFSDGKALKRPKKFVGLLVSGGHTSLTYHVGRNTELLGETVDDAVGEAYDKVAKILGLGYPGGPIIDQLSKSGDEKFIQFTKPKQKNAFDFSFSGIKTAVLYYFRDAKKPRKNTKAYRQFLANITASFQSAVISWCVDKTLLAAQQVGVKDIAMGGGVSANSYLRNRLSEEAGKLGIRVWIPHISLTNDNAAMIARRGYDCYRANKSKHMKLAGKPNLALVSSVT